MSKFKISSHLSFSRSEQGGMLFLSSTIVVLLILYFYIDFSSENLFDNSSPDIVKKQAILDSLYAIEVEAKKFKLYPFNPNFISDYKAYTLGMPTEALDKLKTFRKQGKWISNARQFQQVTGVSDLWLDNVSPFFKFPEWFTHPKPKKKWIPNKFRSTSKMLEKKELNIATEADLMKVSGIGPVLAKRIVTYRKAIGGFSDEVQLHQVYGLSPEVVQRAKEYFSVMTPKEIEKLNINTATASDLATIPGVSFKLAKAIWEFVRLREGVQDLSELEKIEGMTANKLMLIQLYLLVE